MSPIHHAARLLGLVAVLAPVCLAQDDDPPAKPKKVKYAVVDVDGQASIVEAVEVVEMRKKLAAEHKAAVATWEKARGEARKAKAKFAEKKPAARKLKLVANGLPSREAAQKALEKHEAKKAPKPAKTGPRKAKTGSDAAGSKKKKKTDGGGAGI